MKLVLDSGGVSRLAERSPKAVALIQELRGAGLWPPLVPSPVLVECLTGHLGRDASANRLLKACDVITELSTAQARRSARLRCDAQHGSATDAIVAATAEPDGVVLTSDPDDLDALAEHADGVVVHTV
jgi:predicted nucleic acid-binding protein